MSIDAKEHLRRWRSGQARAWVEARRGRWDHVQWLALLGQLRRQGWVGLDPYEVGQVLERCKREYHNLRRWRDSGESWRWVEARRGRWAHHDWMTLLAGLQCWLGPIDPDALAELLEEHRRTYQDLQRWIATDHPALWVEARQGEWDHAAWLELLAALKRIGFGHLPVEVVGQTLEGCKRAYWQLRRWEESGEPYRWVEAHRGRWTPSQWEQLLAGLERSPFGPLDAAAAAVVVERARRRYEDLRRWRLSGAALVWVSERGGTWDEEDFADLLGSMTDEVEPAALRELLEETAEEYAGVQRWLDRRSAVEERLVLTWEDAPARRQAA